MCSDRIDVLGHDASWRVVILNIQVAQNKLRLICKFFSLWRFSSKYAVKYYSFVNLTDFASVLEWTNTLKSKGFVYSNASQLLIELGKWSLEG